MRPPVAVQILLVIAEFQGLFQITAAVVEINLVNAIFGKIDIGYAARIARFLVFRAAFNGGTGQAGIMCAGRVLNPDMMVVGDFF